jgi:predicted aspartyl protease
MRFLSLVLLAAACVLFANVATAQTENTFVAKWSDGPLPVMQFRMPSGKQYCSTVLPSGNDWFGLTKYDDGTVSLSLTIQNWHWTSGGKATFTVDGVSYASTMHISHNDMITTFIDPQGLGRDFLHALYNGYLLSVLAGPVERTFSLSGTAVAITVLNRCTEAITVTRGTTVVPRSNEATLSSSEGVTKVYAVVNGTTGVAFTLDSGAGIVSIPRSLAAKLAAEGSLSQDDFLTYGTFTVADGRQLREPVYRLRSITVGGRTATNIACSISNDDGDPLLGQSFLKKFSSWAVDNARGVLVLN